MSHVVIQAAEFPSIESATQAEAELGRLVADYSAWESSTENPWGPEAVPTPLVQLGERHGVAWPADKHSRFVVKGMFEDEAQLLRVDRLLFFWVPGFDLGGEWLRDVLRKLGAVTCNDRPFIVVRAKDPQARAEEAGQFLLDEDQEDQYSITQDDGELQGALFAITFENDDTRAHLAFDDSGVQDWAFVLFLPQLSGDDPALRNAPVAPEEE